MTEYEEEMLNLNRKHIEQRIENEKEIHKKELEILEFKRKVEEKKIQVLEKYLKTTNFNNISLNSF